jgi:hypothetical protein
MQITMYSYYWFLRIALHFIFAPMLLKTVSHLFVLFPLFTVLGPEDRPRERRP